MNIEIDGRGEVMYKAPQQKWVEREQGVLQISNFAGQELIAITDDAGGFDLHYLGFKVSGFKTIEDAKKAAPTFARKVLARLAEMISD